uniref:Prokaryotic molybdopterin-containing oxidoreductase family, iron-sulfur binding subunit n=1 Tax=Candidatus Kentrum sp. SD TaxID=2126332 RepID=A0A450YHX0_9GAMM|nr:MAG: prokaryotic molybdopterin-containing oxidoreductase family, iron-sulfur binding subunit [Candidatus Kentron sp. SD]VFK46297.1 MAG: prokaryotic molybdopterin-containing oxidoreductase family, iron-sulfur binding subunit [Candidatus Kentron sp. SD]VFK79983.1 MAG: prokaryotic molybdopterin-containing oxidoreductase family, iron-sulfur binding subunit [Candidatus Kentron sp. SD]
MNDFLGDKVINDKQDKLSGPESVVGRRGFLGILGAAVVTVAPGVSLLGLAEARSVEQPAGDDQRWGMLIDVNKCVHGCDECVTACGKENALLHHGRPETDVQWIRKVTIRDPQSEQRASLPLMCQHCRYPPCVDVCPTGASFQRADGVVLVDKHICIGCRYCMMACPYKARSFVHEPIDNQRPHSPRGKGTVEACTLCVHRIDGGGVVRLPACVDACATKGNNAIVFGDLKDPNSQIYKELKRYPTMELRGDMRLEPSVRYFGI